MDKTWKQAERKVAAIFGTKRRPGSGAWQRGAPGETGDDTLHPRLYIEVKSGRTDPGSTLFQHTEPLARAAGKEAVTIYLPKGSPTRNAHAEMRLSTLARLLLPERDPGDVWPHPHQEPDPIVAIRLGELQRHMTPPTSGG